MPVLWIAKRIVEMSAEFRELEEVLRRNEAVLVNQTACRFRCACAAEQHLLHLAQTGAKYLHELLIVSVDGRLGNSGVWHRSQDFS